MTIMKGRRTHSAALLRLRESCPFRTLSRNKSCGSSASSSGSRWRISRDQAAVPAGSYLDTCPPQSPTVPQLCYHSDPQAPVAMDSNTAPSVYRPMFSNFSWGPCTGSVSSPSNSVNFHQRSLSSSDPSMDLDSAVDPETGERAQG